MSYECYDIKQLQKEFEEKYYNASDALGVIENEISLNEFLIRHHIFTLVNKKARNFVFDYEANLDQFNSVQNKYIALLVLRTIFRKKLCTEKN